MPAKNSLKQFVPNAYYHLYNRGVEKRTIFSDLQDYSVFLSYLKTYLLPKEEDKLREILNNPNSNTKEKDKAIKLLRMNNFAKTITLIAYCLLPNHFHLLIKQKESTTIDRFMNSLFTRYSMYFNRKYDRVGPLFQGVYKAVLVTTDEQLLHLSRYIHLNPTHLSLQGDALQSYNYSSYAVYLKKANTSWVKPDDILSTFSKSGFNSYAKFVEDNSLQELSLEKISTKTLDLGD